MMRIDLSAADGTESKALRLFEGANEMSRSVGVQNPKSQGRFGAGHSAGQRL